MNESQETELVRRRAARLSELLKAIDPDDEQVKASARAIHAHLNRPRRQPLLKIAALIALLLLGTLAVPQARAWVARVLGISATPDVARPPLPKPESAAQVSITFAADRDTFDVELVRAGTRLIVRRGDAATSAATGTPQTNFVVLPNGLRIDTRAQDPVQLTLSARVRMLRVLHSHGATTLHRVPASGELEIIQP